MRYASSQSKATRQTEDASARDSSTGREAISMAPPEYGIDFVDQATAVAAPASLQGAPPIQCTYTVKNRAAMASYANKYYGGVHYEHFNWLEHFDSIYDVIDEVRPTLDDDTDRDELKRIEVAVDDPALKADNFTADFATAGERPHGGRPARRRTGAARPAPYSRSTPPTAPAATPAYKEDFLPTLVEYTKWFYGAYGELVDKYMSGGGGFSAKGRAHGGMGVTVWNKKTGVPPPLSWDDTYSKGIKLGTKPLSDWFRITKTSTVTETSGPRIVDGSNLETKGEPTKSAALTQIEGKMNKLKTKPPITYTNKPMARDRGQGQYKNMADTNAAGYAWLANIPAWKNARWEWLHLRAASLGGVTDGSNLVVGTRDCNTNMMPFEANIRALGSIVHDESDYDSVEVDYIGDKADPNAPHKVDAIKMNWKVNLSSSASLGKVAPEGEAVFDPLETSSHIAKEEVEELEQTLKDIRDDM